MFKTIAVLLLAAVVAVPALQAIRLQSESPLGPSHVDTILGHVRETLAVTPTLTATATTLPTSTNSPIASVIQAQPSATFDLRIPTGWPECLTPPPWLDPVVNERCNNYWPSTPSSTMTEPAPEPTLLMPSATPSQTGYPDAP